MHGCGSCGPRSASFEYDLTQEDIDKTMVGDISLLDYCKERMKLEKSANMELPKLKICGRLYIKERVKELEPEG